MFQISVEIEIHAIRTLMKNRSIRYFVINWAQQWFPSLATYGLKVPDHHKFTPPPSSLEKFFYCPTTVHIYGTLYVKSSVKRDTFDSSVIFLLLQTALFSRVLSRFW